MKLATELSRRSNGRTLYLLDEPTTGLHFEDIRKLLQVLQRLVEAGDTVLVIEHNLDVIEVAVTSSTWGRKAVTWAVSWWRKARRRKWLGFPTATRASICAKCLPIPAPMERTEGCGSTA